MILITENFLEQIVITVTDELSHCGAVSTVKTTPHTATNKCFQPLTIDRVLLMWQRHVLLCLTMSLPIRSASALASSIRPARISLMYMAKTANFPEKKLKIKRTGQCKINICEAVRWYRNSLVRKDLWSSFQTLKWRMMIMKKRKWCAENESEKWRIRNSHFPDPSFSALNMRLIVRLYNRWFVVLTFCRCRSRRLELSIHQFLAYIVHYRKTSERERRFLTTRATLYTEAVIVFVNAYVVITHSPGGATRTTQTLNHQPWTLI